MGLEPTTLGTTIRCSNQLSYIHHCIASFLCAAKIAHFFAPASDWRNFFYGRQTEKWEAGSLSATFVCRLKDWNKPY